jgi:hypothetical protein
MKKEWIWIFVCTAVIFITGFLTGLFADHYFYSQRKMPPPMGEFGRFEHGPGGPPGDLIGGPRGPGGPGGQEIQKKMQERFIEDLTSDLKLDAGQKKRLKEILDKNEKQFQKIRERMHTDFEKFHSKIDAEILEILNDGQKAKFKEISRRFEKNGGPDGGPGHAGPRGDGGPGR